MSRLPTRIKAHAAIFLIPGRSIFCSLWHGYDIKIVHKIKENCSDTAHWGRYTGTQVHTQVQLTVHRETWFSCLNSWNE